MSRSMKKLFIMVIVLLSLIRIENSYSQIQQDWARRYGGTDYDAGYSICADDSGNVYVTGTSEIPVGYKCVTIKYNKYGDSLWVREYQRPGNNYNLGNDIKLDDSCNVYVAGAESVLKYDQNGNLKWTAYHQANYVKLVLDTLGNIYAAGIGSGRYVVAKYDRNGNNYWVNRMPGAFHIKGLVLDNNQNILITAEANYNVTGYDYTTIKYSNAGDVIWIRRYNGLAENSSDFPGEIATDVQSNVYVTGASEDLSHTFNCTTVKYDSSGNTIWIKRIFPPSNGQDIAVDKSHNVYIVSRSTGNNYAIKLDPDGNLVWMRTYPTTDLYPPNHLVLLLDSVNNVYTTANIDSNHYTRYGVIKYDNKGNQLYVLQYSGRLTGFNYVYDMAIDKSGSVYVTGTSQGFMTYYDYATIKYSPVLTGIGNYNFNPLKYSLSQNFPNPFNPETRISYSIPKSGFVKIIVYDISGKEMDILVNEMKQAGTYNLEFNGSNFASGVYLYRLESSDFVQTNRMLLIK